MLTSTSYVVARMLYEFTFHLSHGSFQNRTMTEHVKTPSLSAEKEEKFMVTLT